MGLKNVVLKNATNLNTSYKQRVKDKACQLMNEKKPSGMSEGVLVWIKK